MGALLAWALHWRWVAVWSPPSPSRWPTSWRGRADPGRVRQRVPGLVGGPIVGLMAGRSPGWPTSGTPPSTRRRGRGGTGPAGPRGARRRAAGAGDGAAPRRRLRGRRGELGRLAGEQEQALRSLIRSRTRCLRPHRVDLDRAPSWPPRPPGCGSASRRRTAPSVGAQRVGSPSLVAVVARASTTWLAHVGADAPAWVLLEAPPGAVEVSVRDEGPGIAPGRVDEAAARGPARRRRLDPGAARRPGRPGRRLDQRLVRHRVGADASASPPVAVRSRRDDPRHATRSSTRSATRSAAPRPARGAVSLWTAGEGPDRAGLTVSSLMVAEASRGTCSAWSTPTPTWPTPCEPGSAVVVQLLAWQHRDLAEAFAGTAPAPGGAFAQAAWSRRPGGRCSRTPPGPAPGWSPRPRSAGPRWSRRRSSTSRSATRTSPWSIAGVATSRVRRLRRRRVLAGAVAGRHDPAPTPPAPVRPVRPRSPHPGVRQAMDGRVGDG